jgi:hypothetical protein
MLCQEGIFDNFLGAGRIRKRVEEGGVGREKVENVYVTSFNLWYNQLA